MSTAKPTVSRLWSNNLWGWLDAFTTQGQATRLSSPELNKLILSNLPVGSFENEKVASMALALLLILGE